MLRYKIVVVVVVVVVVVILKKSYCVPKIVSVV